MEPVAYGPLQLNPWEFGRLTFDEFIKMTDGVKWRSKEEQITTAGFVATLINCCTPNRLKRPVTVEMLIGKDAEAKDLKTAQEDMKQLLSTVG